MSGDGHHDAELAAMREWLVREVPGLADLYRTATPRTVRTAYAVFRAGEAEAEREARERYRAEQRRTVREHVAAELEGRKHRDGGPRCDSPFSAWHPNGDPDLRCALRLGHGGRHAYGGSYWPAT